MHYARYRRNGDPLIVKPSGRPFSKTDRPGYSAVHYRIRTERGRAPSHACAHCGGQAHDWALTKEAENTYLVPNGRGECRVSLDPNDYIPLCRACHVDHDDIKPYLTRWPDRA